MSFKLKCVAASVMFLATTASFAGGYKDTFKDQMPCPASPMLMDGFYVGAQAGYQTANLGENISITSGTDSLNPSVAVNGWLGGLFLGYGMTWNNFYYLGGEVFGNYANSSQGWDAASLSAGGSYGSNAEMNSSYGLALLPGLRLTDSTLTYIRLGYTWAHFKYNESSSTLGLSASNSSTEGGFTYGIGMETLITGNWSLRGEYTYTNYNSFGTSMNATSSSSINPSASQYSLGVIYHFA